MITVDLDELFCIIFRYVSCVKSTLY